MIDSRDARGDEFTELLAQSERQVFAYVLALVWNAQDAEDLYQQTAMLMWEKFDEFQRGTDFVRWACTFAKHVVFNYQRSRQRRKTFLTAELAATLADRQAAADAPPAYGDALQDCMGQLADTDRRLIQLCYDGRQSIKEIAAALGRPAQSTYNSLCRIRRRLFECVRRAAARRSDT